MGGSQKSNYINNSIMKLISMLKFIEEKGLFTSTFDKEKDDWCTEELEKLEQIRGYSVFLKKSLNYGMFFPCDENGKYLEEPRAEDYFDEGFSLGFNQKHFYEVVLKSYTEAKKRVIFEGFVFDGMDGVWDSEYKEILHVDTCEIVSFIFEKTVEDLLVSGFEYKLTEYAMENLMLSHKNNYGH